jgi:hypothetical protein
MNAHHHFRHLTAALVLALAFVVSGCEDLGAVDTFDLDPRQVRFEFQFQGGAIDPNGVPSLGTQNLLPFVQQRGFTAGDIVSVRIVNPQLQVALPVTAGVHHFAGVEMRSATGASLVSGQNFAGTSDLAPLQVRATDIAGLVRDGAFSTRLLVNPSAQIQPNQTYTLVVTFDAVVTVEG